MNFDYASSMTDHLTDIVGQIGQAIVLAQVKADSEDYEGIKKSLALLISSIDMDLLWPIYRAYPSLDPIGGLIPPA